MASYRKEPAAEGLGAGAFNGIFEAGPIFVAECADFNVAPVAQGLSR